MDTLRLIAIYQGKAVKHVTNGRWYIGSNNIPLSTAHCDRLTEEGYLEKNSKDTSGYFMEYQITGAGYRRLGR